MSVKLTLVTLAGVMVLMAGPAVAADAPAFPYDASKTASYLNETVAAGPAGSAAELRKEIGATVDEILDGPWAPLYSDYSAAQAGGVGPAEWSFVRPGEQLLALSQAAPYLSAEQKAKAKTQLQALIKAFPPSKQVYIAQKQGKPRTIRKAPPVSTPSGKTDQTQRELFGEAYSLWAFATAFDAWDDVKPCFDDIKALRAQLEQRGDLTPAYKPGEDGVLTAAGSADPEYRFVVYESMISGFQDNYGYGGAREAQRRMEKDKPVFFYVKNLSALIGYYRLASHFGDQAEMKWAQESFTRLAGVALSQKSAPFLWSDPYLVPELGRLFRDNAGKWLDELSKTANVGDLPASDWNNKLVAGKREKRVVNPYTWFQAWGGQGEGVRPRTVMGAFLVNAWLFNAPAEQVAQTRDIPWSKADLYYLRKLVVATQVAEKAGWAPIKQ